VQGKLLTFRALCLFTAASLAAGRLFASHDPNYVCVPLSLQGNKNENGTTCNHCSLLLGVVNTTLCGCCQQFVHACNVCRSRCTAAGTSD
jgi:hypothetical protein